MSSREQQLRLRYKTLRQYTGLLSRAVAGDVESERRFRGDYDHVVRNWCGQIFTDSDDPGVIANLAEVAWTRFILTEECVCEATKNLQAVRSLEINSLLRARITANSDEILQLAAGGTESSH
jgi:hypothetical protein